MPWGRYVLGYHGCDSALARSVASGRRDLQSSENDFDWLGHGRYFWEESPRRAIEWATAESRRRNSQIKNPGVLGAVIDLGNCLNLIDADFIELVRKAHSRLLEIAKDAGQTLPRNAGKDFGARRLDCAVFEALHQFRIDEGLPAFETVRAFFIEGKPIYRGAGLRHLDHIQICVREPKQILGYFLPRALDPQRAQPLRDKIDAALVEGIESGPSTPMTAQDWDDIRREGRRRLAKRKKTK